MVSLGSLSLSLSLYIRIMKTPIFRFFPIAIKHHALIISKTQNTEGVYLLDYTPITKKNESQLKTHIKLLMGWTVPAEIRLRLIRDAKLDEDEKIVASSDILDVQDAELSKEISKGIYENITDIEIKETIGTMINKSKHNNTMNLYSYNCQSFCNELFQDGEE